LSGRIFASIRGKLRGNDSPKEQLKLGYSFILTGYLIDDDINLGEKQKISRGESQEGGILFE